MSILATNNDDDNIKLNFGGTIFETSRSTLCKFEDSFFAKMFNGNMKPGKLSEDGSYFFDEDPKVFEIVLKYLREGELPSLDPNQVKIVKKMADKFCLSSLMKALEPQVIELDIKKRKINDKIVLSICRKHDGEIIDNNILRLSDSQTALFLIQEHNYRDHNNDLCYLWSGKHFNVYNCRTNKRIGPIIENEKIEKDLIRIDKFLKLDLISTAKKIDERHYYIASFNEQCDTAIFDANTGEKITDIEESYEEELVKYISTLDK